MKRINGIKFKEETDKGTVYDSDELNELSSWKINEFGLYNAAET